MTRTKSITRLMIAAAPLALAACGAEDIASPGTGGNITINNPPAATPTPPTTQPPASITPAAGCPTIDDPQGLTDGGTITGATGTYRVCRLPSLIRRSITLPKISGLLYEINGRVNVGCDGGFNAPTAAAPFTSTTVGCTTPLTADTNVVLNIAPGAILYGATGQSFLAVNRGNRINATGTTTQPIVFTSRDNVLGLNTDASQGQWGGVVLLGRGVITDCNFGSVASNTCERETEGSPDPARFGGSNNAYNAGTMSFVQIRYSGFVLGADRELQALTTGGIGTGTTLDHIQVHNSSDDGAEFFGGAVNLKYYVATGADDDSLDADTGVQGNFQYVLLLPRAGRGDALFEIDSNGFEGDTPRSRLNIVNFTAIQPQVSPDNEAANQAAALFRGNSDVTLANGVLVAPANECIRLNGSGANPVTLTARAVQLQCNSTTFIGTGSINAAAVAAAFGSGSNQNNAAFVSSFSSVFINGANENAIVSTFDAKTLSPFFDTTNYVGAVRNSSDTWFAGWTCSTGSVNFGAGSTSCTSLPTT